MRWADLHAALTHAATTGDPLPAGAKHALVALVGDATPDTVAEAVKVGPSETAAASWVAARTVAPLLAADIEPGLLWQIATALQRVGGPLVRRAAAERLTDTDRRRELSLSNQAVHQARTRPIP
jgi:hypothetical protein